MNELDVLLRIEIAVNTIMVTYVLFEVMKIVRRIVNKYRRGQGLND